MASLALTLLRGAARSPFKRPRPDAPLPGPTTARVRTGIDHLVAYERLCGFAAGQGGGRSADGGGPAGGDPLPPTYPHVLAFPQTMRLMAARDFPLPLLGLVHTSVEIVQHRAPLPDDELELTTYARSLAPHRRGTEAMITTSARVHGETVWESHSTYLSRHRTTADHQEADRTTADHPETDHPAPAPAKAPGAPLPARADWRLPADLGRRYAAVSGDRNPIHLHAATARLFGFPRAIAHGMWTVARCVAEHSGLGAVDEPLYVSAEFKAPVLLPGAVTYAAEGAAFELRGATGATEATEATEATGRVHVTGSVTRTAPPSDRRDPPRRSSSGSPRPGSRTRTAR
ncbi:MaoC/PaaZ C-terminal domain-containing protein [Streptomyces flavofungini]|uniref:MaoC/PaaZ C-terminal domain-containing protein n=1 Tax=Streptomyces flavofungini TaxID=68200 RepID=UPI0025AF202A|nr:MaoC/PaaZ C-terminal domain-containing protein [Streptomyces flavofungini]WJV46944.1 MaoC/PaaZ C-terminal domain-containing protein [Streptomyces flavofungini]